MVLDAGANAAIHSEILLQIDVGVSFSSLTDSFAKVARNLWASSVPSKIHVFGWRLLIGRLATRDQLVHRSFVKPAHNSTSLFASVMMSP